VILPKGLFLKKITDAFIVVSPSRPQGSCWPAHTADPGISRGWGV